MTSSRIPSARTASLAVLHQTPRPWATRAMDRCCTTIPLRAHLRRAREIFEPGWAAACVLWRHTWPQPVQRYLPRPHHQRGGAPPQGHVRQAPGHRLTRTPLTAAPPTPVIRLKNPAGQHRTLGLNTLPGDLKTEIVQASESSQARRSKGSVRHVEAFPVSVSELPSSEDPDTHPRTNTPHPAHTTTPPIGKSQRGSS